MSSFEDVSITQRLRMMGDDVRLFRWVASHSMVLALPQCLSKS